MNRNRSGFTILGALFMLIVLSAAGAGMVRISGVQRTTTSYSLLGARAYQAARAGLEWAIHEAVDSGACAASTSFSLSEAGLDGFDVVVTCASTVHIAGGLSTTVYRIAADADRGSFGSRDYTRRQLEATVSNLTP